MNEFLLKDSQLNQIQHEIKGFMNSSQLNAVKRSKMKYKIQKCQNFEILSLSRKQNNFSTIDLSENGNANDNCKWGIGKTSIQFNSEPEKLGLIVDDFSNIFVENAHCSKYNPYTCSTIEDTTSCKLQHELIEKHKLKKKFENFISENIQKNLYNYLIEKALSSVVEDYLNQNIKGLIQNFTSRMEEKTQPSHNKFINRKRSLQREVRVNSCCPHKDAKHYAKVSVVFN
jgi:hypothetical protein